MRQSMITEHPCTIPNDPINGHKNCTEDHRAVHCTLACEDGFAFAFRPTGDYTCDMSGSGAWGHTSETSFNFPDCSVTSLSSVISIPTQLQMSLVSRKRQLEQSSLCDDSFFFKQVLNFVTMRIVKMSSRSPLRFVRRF